MKKIFLYSLALLSALSFNACSDDDDNGAGTSSSDRLFRPMFRCDNNTGKGDNDPYNCTVVNTNDAQLYWYTVDDAVAYEIKWAVQNYVANGEDAWIEAEQGLNGKSLAGDTVITDPSQYYLLIENLDYQTDYRFAIRALHSYSTTDDSWKTDPKNSEWYGYGNGRQWADYLGIQTGVRYEVPYIIQVSDITKTSMRVNLNRSTKGYTADQLKDFAENFTIIGDSVFKVDYLTVTASQSTPDAQENPTYVKYYITEEDWARGYIDVDGLSENSVYNIDVWDADIAVKVDACYNSLMKRTKGDPGAPILVEHVAWQNDTTSDGSIYNISSYNAMKLDDILNDYCSSNTLAENQVFYLEGGKAYYCSTNVSVYKGLTLQTNPDDVAQGKRATLYLNGLYTVGASPASCNFMLGRQPVAGENASITLDIDSIRFVDLDVDCPQSLNYGHKEEGLGSATGNYFMNMYSNGMGINVTLLEWNNCTFQGLIRGFFRIQGSNDFYIQNLKMIDCVHYNCGFYDAKGGGYSYLFADHNGKPKSNILQNVEISGNVVYDSPKGAFLTDNNRNLNWDESVRWNINIHHNTFVNFTSAGSSNQTWLNTRYLPGGSVVSVHDNIFIQTRDAADVNRDVQKLGGYDVRNIQGGDGSGTATFNIYNNWTTNDDYLVKGQPFKTVAFNATKNAPGAFYNSIGSDYFPYGQDELTVHVDELKATDLMVSPNPKNFIGLKRGHLDHHTDTGIDGLYYQQTDAVLNSEIYKSGAGAPRLRNGK